MYFFCWCIWQIDPNREIQLDVSSTSSDSDNDYMTPLKDVRKEELLEKLREKKKQKKLAEKKKKAEKKRKRKHKER